MRALTLSFLCLITPFGICVRAAPADERAAPLRVLMISGAEEYNTDESLAALKTFAEQNYRIACTLASGKDNVLNDLKQLDSLDRIDVLAIYCRRFRLPKEQLEHLKSFVLAGKPVVGIRTASHAFQDWLEMDKVVLGGNYNGHYGDEPADVIVEENQKEHPVLAGVEGFPTRRLYKNAGHANDVTVLLTGKTPKYSEPVAWTRTVNGGRVFYTSLGVQEDFKNKGFLQMLVNALFWTAQRDIKKEIKP